MPALGDLRLLFMENNHWCPFDISGVVLLYEPGKIIFSFIKVDIKLQLVSSNDLDMLS